jgi:hypothetical protein
MMTPKPAAGAKPPTHQRRQLAGGSALFGPGMSVFVGKGNEAGHSIFAASNSTVKSGFYVLGKDRMYMTAELVNYEPQDRDIYVMLDYEYIPSTDGKRPADYMDVGMGSIAVDGCIVTALGKQFFFPSFTLFANVWQSHPRIRQFSTSLLTGTSPSMATS